MTRRVAVDLFAGAGGLSLGLHEAGFSPVLAVELSAMAAETYFWNFVARSESEWRAHLSAPLGEQIRSGLAVSSMASVLEHCAVEDLEAGDHGEIDLVAGGPPCQGFSLAGLRNPEDQRNTLPFEFLKFVESVNPRAVLIENVAGIGMSFARRPGQAPLEQLREALRLAGRHGYVAQILDVNARDFGVGQFRPRVMIVGLRRDLAQRLVPNTPWDHVDELLSSDQWSSGSPQLLPPLLAPQDRILVGPTVDEALVDLDHSGYRFRGLDEYAAHPHARQMRFSTRVRSPTAPDMAPAQPLNHVLRKHGPRTTLRFQLYLSLAQFSTNSNVFAIGRKYSHDIRLAQRTVAEHLAAAHIQYPLRMPDGAKILDPTTGEEVGATSRSVRDAVLELATGKHSQRPLRAGTFAPTMLSLPDDFVHYREARTLTVREMARIQSFPDSFEFRSKETTGSSRRRHEVPQYTQVGNAVPPLMALAVASHIASVLDRVDATYQRRTTVPASAIPWNEA